MNSEIKEPKADQIGQFISDDLSNYLRQFTSFSERHITGHNMGLSGRTCHALIMQERKVTQKTYPALLAIVSLAIQNCKKATEEAKQAESFMKPIIEE